MYRFLSRSRSRSRERWRRQSRDDNPRGHDFDLIKYSKDGTIKITTLFIDRRENDPPSQRGKACGGPKGKDGPLGGARTAKAMWASTESPDELARSSPPHRTVTRLRRQDDIGSHLLPTWSSAHLHLLLPPVDLVLVPWPPSPPNVLSFKPLSSLSYLSYSLF